VGNAAILDGIVEKSGGDGEGIHAQAHEDVSRFNQMEQIRIARSTDLAGVMKTGEFIRTRDHASIIVGVFGARFTENV